MYFASLFVLFALSRLCLILAAPIPQQLDPAFNVIEVDIETLTTTVDGVATAATQINAQGFTPLFEPDTTQIDFAVSVSSSVVPPAESSVTSVPAATVTQFITAFYTPEPSTIVSYVNAAPSITIVPATPAPTPTPTPTPVPSPPPAPTPTPAPSPPSPPPTPGNPSSSWSVAAQFTDLDCFNVQKYAGGSSNMQVVTGIPATATATSAAAQATATAVQPVSWNNDTDNALQLFYPKGSINPGNKPQGGADFYATPISLDGATNVTMEYSVFMDAGFEWVKGGKLPGLYGGHDGCSGGNVADTCFSTRLMWRPEGAGELYLYAEKAKQLPELCQTPNASCNEVYGLSLGRGSFTFALGTWTNLRQTVRLNTPGIPDGGFTLDVNGKRVLELSGIYYRDVKGASDASSAPVPSPMSTQPASPPPPPPTATASLWQATPPAPTASPDAPPMTATGLPPLLGGLLDGLGGLLGSPAPAPAATATATPGADPLAGLFGRGSSHQRTTASHRRRHQQRSTSSGTDVSAAEPVMLIAPRSFRVPPQSNLEDTASSYRYRRSPQDQDPAVLPGEVAVGADSQAVPTPTSTVAVPTAPAESTIPPPAANILAAAATPEPAFGFTGIFFSTFFGGHDPSWASPKDQYMWFKGFALTVNN